jgi:hypothetical protein
LKISFNLGVQFPPKGFEKGARCQIITNSLPTAFLSESVRLVHQSHSPAFLVMSDKKDAKKGQSSFFTGFSTGTALRLWLFFLFFFIFLGYSPPLSILLGFAGGFAGGWVVGWWKSKEGPTLMKSEEEEEADIIEDRPARERGLRRLAERRKDTRGRKRPSGSLIPFGNFLRR